MKRRQKTETKSELDNYLDQLLLFFIGHIKEIIMGKIEEDGFLN